MAGYLGNDEATTGDHRRRRLAAHRRPRPVDASGCVYIVDRLKELIKYKGYQVPPAELEAVLLTHPGDRRRRGDRCATMPNRRRGAKGVRGQAIRSRADRGRGDGVRRRSGRAVQEGASGGVHRRDPEVRVGQDPAQGSTGDDRSCAADCAARACRYPRMAPAAGINSSPATPHNGSATPAVGATTSRWTTPGCSRTGLMAGGFSGTVITSGRRRRWGGFGRRAAPARFGVVVLDSRRPPVAECHFRLLELRRIGAVIGAGPLIGRSRFATRSDSARRTVVDAGVGFAAAAAVDVVVAPVRTAARAWGGPRLLLSEPLLLSLSSLCCCGTAGVPTARIGHRDCHAGPAYQKTRGHDTDTCREAEVRLGHSSSPAGGKDMQTACGLHSCMPTPGRPPLRRMHAN